MKWIRRIIVLIVLLVLLAVGGIYLALDSIVKSVVQTEGTEQLKVPTTLGGVSLGLIKGTVDLNTMALGSPAGFTAPQMFSVGKFSVDTGGVSHLREQPIHISTIAIDAPSLVIEQHGTKLNFRELINGLPSHPDNGGSTPTTSSGKPATKLIIDTLTMNNGHVQILSDLPGMKPIEIVLPAMNMEKIGNSDGNNTGVAIKDVAVAIITKMVAQATKSKEIPAELQVLLTGNLTDIQDKMTGAAQKELGALNLPGAIKGNVNDAAKGLLDQGFKAFGGDKK